MDDNKNMQNIIDGIRRYYPVSDNSLNILFSKDIRIYDI